MVWAQAEKASEIYEALLERTGKALIAGDFDTFSSCFSVPHTIDTPDGKVIIETRDALEALFLKVVQDFRDRNVTTLIRTCEVAEFRGHHKVEATHVSNPMSGDQRVMEPFIGFSVVEFIDGRWQLTSTQYAGVDQTNVSRALQTLSDTNT